MLDFAELPRDGVRFEQLIREILLIRRLRPHWTGKGADSGRDLLVEEPLSGSIKCSSRLWLVDCKHFAHSNSSVGVSDVSDIRDRCERVGAAGFLLACSTTATSELVRKFSELKSTTNIEFEIWDAISIERLIVTPQSYSLAQQFFPRSTNASSWKLFYTEREERWMAHFAGHFLYVESRAGIDPPPLSDLRKIIEGMERVLVGAGEKLRIRAIWHDTPNGPFYQTYVDYLVPSEGYPSLSPMDMYGSLDESLIDGGSVSWYSRLQVTMPQSDYYSDDDPAFYKHLQRPLIQAFYGLPMMHESSGSEKWFHLSPPPIRTFNDQLIWSNNMEKFGFKKLGNLVVRET